MSLQVKTFRINDDASESAMNQFLRGKRVIQWSADHDDEPTPNGTWSVIVGYEEDRGQKSGHQRERSHQAPPKERKEPKEPKVEHVPDLAPEQLPLYENIRKWRNQRAREENIKPYLFFNNKQLEDMVKAKPADIETLKPLTGDMSPEHFEKYGNELLGVIGA